METQIKVKVGSTYRQAGTGALLTCDLEHEGWKGTEFRFLLSTEDGKNRFWYNEQGKALTSYQLCEEVSTPDQILVVGFGSGIDVAGFESVRRLAAEFGRELPAARPVAVKSLCPDCFA